MDITITGAATKLGTSVHRVTRAIKRLSIATSLATGERGRPPHVLDDAGFARLLGDLGVTPSSSKHSREELFVLAAFNMNPFGFYSRRALATAAGVSPTTASLIVNQLIVRGLVNEVPRLRRYAGRVVDAKVLEANRDSAAWRDVLPDVLATRLASPRATREPKIVPRRFWHIFWNADPAQLTVLEHADLIASRMLLSKDPLAVSWVLTHLPASSIEKAASLRQVGAQERRWLLNVAAARRETVSM